MPAEEVNELNTPPRFRPGEKVRATQLVRNDGTFPGSSRGEVLIEPGDTGYVRDIGTFLQRYYVYAIEFIDRRIIVGMRAPELEPLAPHGKEQP